MPLLLRPGIMETHTGHGTGSAHVPKMLDGEGTAMHTCRVRIVKAISLAALYLVLQFAALVAVVGLWTAAT